jgi:hypothetical protein
VSGGNLTGMANMVGDAIGNGVELLQTILPSAKRIARGSWLGTMSERPAPIFPLSGTARRFRSFSRFRSKVLLPEIRC